MSTTKDDLPHLEETIEQAEKSFVNLGVALGLIRDKRLYQPEHNSFAGYLKDRFDLQLRYANQMITSAGAFMVVQSVIKNGSYLDIASQIKTERQCRELAGIDNIRVADIFRDLKNRCVTRPTAKELRKSRKNTEPSGLAYMINNGPSAVPEPETSVTFKTRMELSEVSTAMKAAARRVNRVEQTLREEQPETAARLREEISGLLTGALSLCQAAQDLQGKIDGTFEESDED